MAKPWVTLIWPPAKAANVRISVAWVDCSTTVSKRPMPLKIATSIAPPERMLAKSRLPPTL